jgi:hypothetical protein
MRSGVGVTVLSEPGPTRRRLTQTKAMMEAYIRLRPLEAEEISTGPYSGSDLNNLTMTQY